jgi:hypothetical protein
MFNFLNKDKPVKIRFFFNNEHRRKNMTWDDKETIEMIQEGERSQMNRRLKLLMAHFMVDENNQAIPEDVALKILGRLNEEDQEEVARQFTETMQNSAVPPTNGSNSIQLQEAGLMTTLPDGSTP